MRTPFSCTAAAVLAASLLAGTNVQAGHSRENPVVTAVKAAHNSIVTIKIEKRGAYTKRDVSGTGVIIDARGYVLTNCHVVSGGENPVAVLADETAVDAEVVFTDPDHDMAVVRLPAGKKYQEMRFAPASDLMVGEEVIAIGHPYGYTNTVSTGIVSALNREVAMQSGGVLTNLIQTTASINPGNSGGPLMNINGELIGINSAMRSDAQGIAFALNADMVQQVLSQQLSAGRMAHVRHGMICHEVVKDEDGEDREQVVVDEVAAKGPAAAAGLKRGDVLVKVDGRKVSNRFDVERALWDSKPGDEISVSLRRDDKTVVKANLTLSRGNGERTEAEAPAPEVAWDMDKVGTPVSTQK